MRIITIHTKPEMGNRERLCAGCGEMYRGWNFVLCQECERDRNAFIIVRAW